MTKTNLFLVTLVPALPAALLLFLLIGAFIGESTPSGMLQIVCGLGALSALAVALLPVAAFFFGTAAAPKAPKKAKKEKEAAAEEAEEEEAEEASEDEFGESNAAADDWDGVEFEDEEEQK